MSDCPDADELVAKTEAESTTDIVQFHHEWTRFQHIYDRRKAHFTSEAQQQTKATQRLFIISSNDDPWNIFGLTTRIEYCRRVFEVSALHFSDLHHACATSDDKHPVRSILLSSPAASPCRGCTLTRDSSGRIPLHHAVVREHHTVTRLLLRQADMRLQLHARDNRDATPVQYVLEKIQRIRHKQKRKHLGTRYRKLSRLADRMLASMHAPLVRILQSLDFRARGDAWDAVRGGNVARLKQIHKLYGDHLQDDDHTRLCELGTTLLHEACCSRLRALDVVLYLISELHADRRVVDQSGSTPLHCVAVRGWIEACVLLLDGSGDDHRDCEYDPEELLLMTDARGRTPLHMSLRFAVSDSVATARFLVQQCPQALHIVDCDGFTPLHYAICLGDHMLVQLMIDVGADVMSLSTHDSSDKSPSEYGARATWAPCGRIFTRRRCKTRCAEDVSTPAESTVTDAAVDVAVAVDSPNELVASSKACERLRKVKAGLVEHPGTALPMETLWFWVHNKQKKPRLPSAPCVATTDPVPDTLPSSQELDQISRYGCRRFGAVCPSCRHLPGEHSGPESPVRTAVSVPPLVVAIRCCRGAQSNQTSSRFDRLKIVETLVLAGSPLEDLELEEALRTPQAPEILELVLTHSGRRISTDQVVRQFCSGTIYVDDLKARIPLLCSLMDDAEECDVLTFLPALFRCRYFRVIDHIIGGRADNATFLRALAQPRESLVALGTKQRRLLPSFEVDHLDWAVRLCTASLVDCGPEWSALVVACISELLSSRSSTWQRSHARNATDMSIVSALDLVHRTAADILDPVAIDWTVATITKGLAATTRWLWSFVIGCKAHLASQFMQRLEWPLRSVDVRLTHELPKLIPSLVDAVLDQQQWETTDFNWNESHTTLLCMTLAITVVSGLGDPTMRRLLVCATHAHCEGQAAEVLCGRLFSGLSPVEYTVQHDRVEIAELLMTGLKTSDTANQRLWVAFTKARLAFSHSTSSTEQQWQVLLFSSAHPSVSADSATDLILKYLVRAPQPCTAVLSCLLRLVVQHTDPTPSALVQWVEQAGFIHAMARWNAIHLVKQWAALVNSDEISSTWLRLVTQRNDSDDCTPIELCELLGHHQLAAFLRELDTSSASAVPSHTIPERRRHFGLFRTAMSLSCSSGSSAHSLDLYPRIHTKVDPLAVFRGDWSTAVALDDLRMLQTYSLHDLPLESADGNDDQKSTAFAELLETAIQYGSLHALQWLLEHFPTVISELPVETTTQLLHKAARHTSTVYAQLTLCLLRHTGFSPGRLSGDGADISLLHRVARFSDSELGIQALQLLLQIDGSDVNVRDGFGLTPVMYALASGRMEIACWLMSNRHGHHTRLEAEYEGQCGFYYALHLLPSFAWRCVVQQLLTATRQAAFLHCEDGDGGGDCACKGFEVSSDTQCCAFCSHSMEMHTRVPYPPWFRDQYESYVVHAADECGVDGDHEGDEDDEEDEEAKALRRQRAMLESPLVDERTLEKERGRLRVSALYHITQLRFHEILTQYDLRITFPVEEASVSDDGKEVVDAEEGTYGETSGQDCRDCRDSGANLAEVDAVSLLPRTLPPPPPPPCKALSPWSSSNAYTALLPRIRSGDSAIAHAHEACCCPATLHLRDATTHSTKLQIVLAKWFCVCVEQDAEPVVFRCSDREQAQRTALLRWHEVAGSKTSTTVEKLFHEHSNTHLPVAPLSTVETTRSTVALVAQGGSDPEESKVEERNELNLLSNLATDPIGPLGGSPTTSTANHRISILQLFIHHWRYARVYQGFCHWKRSLVNAQVAHQELQSLADSWSAGDRRVKFQALVARQRALEKALGSQGLRENGGTML